MKITEASLNLRLFLWCLFGTVIAEVQSNKEPSYFKAAVFEHSRLGDPIKDAPSDIVRTNLNIFSIATKTAKMQGADMIVFPEYGLYPELPRNKQRGVLETVPDPLLGQWNPCMQRFNQTMLFTLSCMARKYDIVIVANMGDKQPCDPQHHHTKCPEDGVFLYNANVVFDRDGTILARYWKEHPFFEGSMDVPTQPQFPVFTTDFGTFAMFVCFDSIFKPMAEITRRWYIDAVLLPTEWMDMLPQLSAIVYWQAWATGNNITLIVANGQYPYQGTIGSGIFSAELGPLKYTYNPDGISKLVVSRVPRRRNQLPPFQNPDASITIITENGTVPFHDDGNDVPEYCTLGVKRGAGGPHLGSNLRCQQEFTSPFSFVKLTKNRDSLSLYNNDMYCKLKYSAKLGKESYYFGVLNATHSVMGKYFFNQEMCFLLRCDEVNGTTCSIFPMRSKTVFENISITANFSTDFVYPVAVHSAMRLAPKSQWKHVLEKRNGFYSGRIHYTGDGTSPLLTFGLYGRAYDRDPPYVG